MTKIQDLVVFIDRSRIQFGGGAFDSVTTLNLAPEVVKDLEVLDKKTLVGQVTNSIKFTGSPNNVSVIFSDQTVFIKEFPLHTQREELPASEKKFYDEVPFNNVYGKIIPTNRAYEAVAVNAELVQAVIDVLASKSFILDMAIPAFSTGINFKDGLTDGNLRDFTSKKEKLTAYSLIATAHANPVEAPRTQIERGGKSKPKEKSKLPLLIGVFVTLLTVLGVLIATR